MPTFTPGTKLHDRYLLEQQIGSGGMAQVWSARDLVLDRQVAVKTLTGQATADSALRAGARREAQSAAQLAHPNITAVHDYAELWSDDGTVTPYLVMELLRGETLAERLARGAVPWPQAATIGAQVAAALAAAHAQGVVHQDIKPANIMLTPTGVKVLDFGVARMTGHREDSGWIFGTPAYSPPERLQQAPPEPSADIYGLGVIMYEMITGHRPWPIETWQDAQKPRPTPKLENVPAASTILSALDASPQRRPTAHAMVRVLENHSRPAVALPTLMTRADDPIAAAAPVPHHPTQALEQPLEPPRRGTSPWLVAVGTVAVLAILAAAVYFGAAALDRDRNTVTAGPPPSSASAAPPPSASPSPSKSPLPKGVDGLLDVLRQNVETGIRNQDVDRSRREELRNMVEDLEERWNDEDEDDRDEDFIEDFVKRVGDAREKVADRANDSDIKEELAENLDLILKEIMRVASSD